MITFIQGITTSGELGEGSSYELIAILKAAETNLDRIEKIQVWKIHLQNLLNLGILSAR